MMRRLMEGWRRRRSLRRRSELESGLDEEIQFHIDRQTEKNVRAGMAPDEGHRQALITFGGVERAKESTRDQFRFAFVEDFLRDLRYGGRSLLRAPGFTIAATLTLALGVGATTAMFSVVNGIVLRPLPYPEQDRLIELVHEAPGLGIGQLFASPAIYFAYRDHSRTFESVGLWDWDSSPVTVTGSGEPESVQSLEVTHEVLMILGADPIVGRGFSKADDLPGSAPTAIISYGYWQRHFGGAHALGRTSVVNGIPRQVIGVLPQSFRFFDYPADIFYPLQPVRSAAVFPSFDGRAIARLKGRVTLREANADVARMIPILSEEFGRPGARFEKAQFGPKLRWLKDTVVGDLGDTLWLLMGTIGLLLLIACANVANLVLVRTQTRRPELAIRAALGADWTAITRVVFTESAILGLAGGVAGLAVAYFSLPLLFSLSAADLPHIMTVTIDPTVLLVTLGTSVLATLMFGLIPVFHFALPKLQVAGALHADGDGRSNSILVEGRTPVDDVTSPKEIQFVSPHFFETLLTPLIAGRTFDWNDVYQSRRVVMVSENLARTEWGSAGAALVLVGVGVAIGLGAATGLTRMMESQLFGVSPLDPLTHLAVALVLTAAAGLASYLSVQRASALDPVEVLKGE